MSDVRKNNQPEDFGLEVDGTAEIMILEQRDELYLCVSGSGFLCLSQESSEETQCVHFRPEHVSRVCAALHKMKAEMDSHDQETDPVGFPTPKAPDYHVCRAAAAVEPVATSQSQPAKATVSYDAEHDCFNFPHPLDKGYWVQRPRCMKVLLSEVRHWRDSGFPDEQIIDLLICEADVRERSGPGEG